MLRLLRTDARLSRAEIARQTGLSEGTVSRIVAELIDRGLVAEDGAENSTGGRPATRLRLSSERAAMGVDIGTWETRFAVGTIRGQVAESDRLRTLSTPEQTIELIAERFRGYVAEHGPERLNRIGVSIRGIVNSNTGVVEMGRNTRWYRVAVRDRLQDLLGVPVSVGTMCDPRLWRSTSTATPACGTPAVCCSCSSMKASGWAFCSMASSITGRAWPPGNSGRW